MQYLDEELDITTQKIQTLEKELLATQELLGNAIASLKETQRYLMKMAYNQAEITKKISHWPYIVVHSNKNDEL